MHTHTDIHSHNQQTALCTHKHSHIYCHTRHTPPYTIYTQSHLHPHHLWSLTRLHTSYTHPLGHTTYTQLSHIPSHIQTHTVTHTHLHTQSPTHSNCLIQHHTPHTPGTCILHPPLPKLTTGHAHQSNLLIHVLIYSSQYLLMTVSSMNLYHLLFMLIPLFIILSISGAHGDVSAEGSRSVVCPGRACVPQCLLSPQPRCPVNTGEGMHRPEMV